MQTIFNERISYGRALSDRERKKQKQKNTKIRMASAAVWILCDRCRREKKKKKKIKLIIASIIRSQLYNFMKRNSLIIFRIISNAGFRIGCVYLISR